MYSFMDFQVTQVAESSIAKSAFVNIVFFLGVVRVFAHVFWVGDVAWVDWVFSGLGA